MIENVTCLKNLKFLNLVIQYVDNEINDESFEYKLKPLF
jgi:hypothetical protein